MIPRFHTLWSINAPLNQARLRRQLEQFRAHGFAGVVWHPRFYPGEPPYLDDRYLAEVSDVILHAKSLGLGFWIYDENGWPSGTVGGQLLKKYPADAQRFANLVPEKPASCLAEFKHSGKKWFLAECIGNGVDYFNPCLARHFIELTHDRYRHGLKPEAWEHVEAIFSDEPEFGLGHAYDSLSKHGAIPWTPPLPEQFRARYGEELVPRISNLFFAGAGAAETRVKFWELLTDLFNASFTVPINDWCRRNGKLFTAHVKGEEHPLFQVPTSGSCHQFYRNLDLPGIDALERDPGNNFYPRQLSAAARQFGSGHCMVEAFGGAGWGATPEDLERYLLWLGRHGITDFVMHLSQYRLDSAAMHDWPASQPLHLSWREIYPEVLMRVRCELENHPRPPADTLVIAPIRGVMANYEPWEFLETNVHNAATYPDTVAGKVNRRFLEQIEELHRAGVNFDVADERTVEQFGKVANGRLTVGKCEYRGVIVPDGCQLSAAAASGVELLMGKMEPAHVEVKRVEEDFDAHSSIPVRWKLEAQPVNTLLLEPKIETDGTFVAHFQNVEAFHGADCSLVFADNISRLEVNAVNLQLGSSEEGSVSRLDGVPLQGINTIRFETALKVERPFVWLTGHFRVQSHTPIMAGPNGTIKTEGPFLVGPAREAVGQDLVADGFPFLHDPLVVSAEIKLPHTVSKLRLDGIECAAVRLSVDGRDLGWHWHANSAINFTINLPSGRHRVRLEMIPNTFNSFGPHHYYGGDWHVISPDQIKGVRNFADPPDAPANTHVAAWHFRKFKLPSGISIWL
jgi:hypothetical protein